MKVGRSLTNVSAFARPDSQIIKQTAHGAIVTCLGTALAFVLLCSELYQVFYAPPVNEMGASTERHALMDVALDITFPRLPCAIVSIDMLDASGEVESDAMRGIEHMHLLKHRLDAKGKLANRQGYKAPEKPDVIAIVNGMLVTQSNQHMKDMDEELKSGEGCHVHGTMQVRRLSGAIRLTAHADDFMMLKSTQDKYRREAEAALAERKAHPERPALAVHTDFSSINMTHHIQHLRFGPQYPGRVNPLDAFDRVVDHDYGSFRYFLTIVPTQYVTMLWSKLETFSYSVTEYFLPGSAVAGKNPHQVNVEVMPSLEFRIKMSPIAVKVWYPNRRLGHVLVRLCAVLGGCFALTQWLDKVVNWVMQLL